MGGKRAHPIAHEWYWMKDDPLECWRSMDWAAVRRGRQVYTEVFAPCHKLGGMVTFSHFQGFMTREEIKKLAAQYDIVDKDPDDEGNLVTRKGKPTDFLPAPYPNSRAAQFANNGAEPPDLQTSIFGLEGGADYIYSLITGYNWGNGELLPVPPFAPEMKAGQFWNPYFKGGIIGMPNPLSDGMIDYEDGTDATVAQMAKDVVTFLRFTTEMEFDDRRMTLWKGQISLACIAVLLGHWGQKWMTWKVYQRHTYKYWGKTW